MFSKLRTVFIRNRYKLAIFVLLNAACAFCMAIVAVRVAYSDSARYISLVWNLFLAWIPFILAYLAYTFSLTRRWLFILIPAITILWLIFFPNAPYILTDLQHLEQGSTRTPLWYDVIMLVWFSWTGMLLGIVSLYMMHNIMQRAFGRWIGWIFVFAVSGLSSLGIYVGRFMRWNSWDILQDTRDLAIGILGLVIDPSWRFAAFTILYTVFFLFVYLMLYSFGHLLQEQAALEKSNG